MRRPLCFGVLFFAMCLALVRVFHPAGPPEPDPRISEAISLHRQIELTGQITSYEKKTNSAGYLLSSCYLTEGGQEQSLDETFYLYLDDPTLPIGSIISVRGNPAFLSGARNHGQFDGVSYYSQKGAQVLFFGKSVDILAAGSPWSLKEAGRRTRNFLTGVLTSLLGKEESRTKSVLLAMLLGDQTEISQDTRALFRTGGFLHILTVSGMHLTLLGMGMFELLRRLFLPERLAALLAGIGMLFYVFVAGAGTATLRAGLMFDVLLLGKIVGRTYDPPTGLAIAAACLLLWNPELLAKSSFLLSVMATLAATVFVPMFTRESEEEREAKRSSLRRRKNYRFEKMRSALKQSLQFSLILHAAMLPLTLWFFYEIPVYGLLSSLVLLPSVSWVMISGVAAVCAALPAIFTGFGAGIGMEAGKVLLWPAAKLLDFYFAFLHRISRLPGASLVLGRPELWQIFLYYGLFLLLGICISFFGKGERQRRQGIFALPLLVLLLLPLPGPDFSITMLDVGQGDCILIHSGRSNCLIDGGSSDQKQVGSYVIVPNLLSKGIGSLDAVFLTHPDADHINGVEELLTEQAEGSSSLTIRQLFLPFWMPETEAGAKICSLCKSAGIPLTLLRAGDSVSLGENRFQVLYPSEREEKEVWREDGNKGSLVLRLENRGFSALFTGDLPGSMEVGLPEPLACDLLKVAHHGSSFSTTESFLDRAHPKLAVFSCGIGNSYGHPGADTVERIRARGCLLYGTPQSGELCLYRRRAKYYVEGYLDSEQFSML